MASSQIIENRRIGELSGILSGRVEKSAPVLRNLNRKDNGNEPRAPVARKLQRGLNERAVGCTVRKCVGQDQGDFGGQRTGSIVEHLAQRLAQIAAFSRAALKQGGRRIENKVIVDQSPANPSTKCLSYRALTRSWPTADVNNRCSFHAISARTSSSIRFASLPWSFWMSS